MLKTAKENNQLNPEYTKFYRINDPVYSTNKKHLKKKKEEEEVGGKGEESVID